MSEYRYKSGDSSLVGCYGIYTSDGYRIGDVQHGYVSQVIAALNCDWLGSVAGYNTSPEERFQTAIAKLSKLAELESLMLPSRERLEEIGAACLDKKVIGLLIDATEVAQLVVCATSILDDRVEDLGG